MSAARVLPPSPLRLVSVPITETDMPTKKSSLVKTRRARRLQTRPALHQPADADGQLLFSSARGTRLDRHNLMYKVLAPAARRAGVPWVTLHTFRHTCASLLFAPVEHGGGGKNAKQVQEWLGHHSPAYTLKEYVHLDRRGRRRRGVSRRALRIASSPATFPLGDPAVARCADKGSSRHWRLAPWRCSLSLSRPGRRVVMGGWPGSVQGSSSRGGTTRPR